MIGNEIFISEIACWTLPWNKFFTSCLLNRKCWAIILRAKKCKNIPFEKPVFYQGSWTSVEGNTRVEFVTRDTYKWTTTATQTSAELSVAWAFSWHLTQESSFFRSPDRPHAIQWIFVNVISFVMQINHTTKIINSLENERESSHIKRRGWPTQKTVILCDLTGIWKLQHLRQLKFFYLRNVTFYGMLDQPWTTRLTLHLFRD